MVDDLGLSHNAALKLGLRKLLFESAAGPAWVFSDEATEVLRDLWSDVAQGVDEPDRRPPHGLEASTVQVLEGYLVRVICFPRAEEVAENHFAAVAYRPARRGLLFWGHAPASLRYLALELGRTVPEGKHATVLGEWTPDGHLNYGKGPEPTVDNFLEAIRPILARRLRPVIGYVSPQPDR
jgi:hypothetical protein